MRWLGWTWTASQGSSFGRLLRLAFPDRLRVIPANSTTTPAPPHSPYAARSLLLLRASARLCCSTACFLRITRAYASTRLPFPASSPVSGGQPRDLDDTTPASSRHLARHRHGPDWTRCICNRTRHDRLTLRAAAFWSSRLKLEEPAFTTKTRPVTRGFLRSTTNRRPNTAYVDPEQ